MVTHLTFQGTLDDHPGEPAQRAVLAGQLQPCPRGVVRCFPHLGSYTLGTGTAATALVAVS
jgi:hypothetical protein